MSSTPIYDELAATYLADLAPEPREPADIPTPPPAQAEIPAHAVAPKPLAPPGRTRRKV